MKNRNLFLLILLAALWGPSFLFIKVAVRDYPPMTLVAIRLTLAAVFLYIVLRLNKRTLPKGWAFWKKFVVMGFFANALPFVLFGYGERLADSGAASILNGTTPIFTVIMAHFMIQDERLTLNRFFGVFLGFAGILFIFYPNVGELLASGELKNGQTAFGLSLFVLASLSYGFAISFGRANLRGLPPLVGPAAQLICSSAMILPVALIGDRPFHLTPSFASTASAVALGLFGTAFAYLVYYKLVDTASAMFMSFVTYLLPPIGVLLGIIFLDEQPGWYSLAGLALIVAGAVWVNRVGHAPARAPRPVEVPGD
jgi:drug/metabolite transporter (DMT)-like permease